MRWRKSYVAAIWPSARAARRVPSLKKPRGGELICAAARINVGRLGAAAGGREGGPCTHGRYNYTEIYIPAPAICKLLGTS